MESGLYISTICTTRQTALSARLMSVIFVYAPCSTYRNSWWSDLKYANSKPKRFQWNFIVSLGRSKHNTPNNVKYFFFFYGWRWVDCDDEQAECSLIRISFLCELVLYECNVVKKNYKYVWYCRAVRNERNAALKMNEYDRKLFWSEHSSWWGIRNKSNGSVGIIKNYWIILICWPEVLRRIRLTSFWKIFH